MNYTTAIKKKRGSNLPKNAAPNTVQKAYTILEEEGLLVAVSTIGRYVTKDRELIQRIRRREGILAVKRFLELTDAIGIGADELIEIIKKESGLM